MLKHKKIIIVALLIISLLLATFLSALAATTYTVKSGDNLTKIAKQFGVTVQKIAETNGIKDPNVIMVGQVLTIPDTSVQPSPSPSPSTTPVSTQVPINQPYDGLRVMIVGSGSPQIEANRGMPSTLVQYHDKYFLVDCGDRACETLVKNGLSVTKITNLLMTHQHYDHNTDFWTFFEAGSVVAFPRPTLTMVGPDVSTLLNSTLTYYKADIDQRIKGLGLTNNAAIYGTTLMDLTGDGTSFTLDGVKISTMKLPHGVTDYAYKFEADGQSVVISGDFLNEPKLADFAKGVDIFVVDGMLTASFDYIPNVQARAGLKKTLEISHVTQDQLAAIVTSAGAKQTILSHLGGSSNIDQVKPVFVAAGYTGPLMDAYDGMIIEPLK